MEGYHSSVLLGEAIDALAVRDASWYLDATIGDGGHSIEIIKRGGKVIGIDVDPQALERARNRFKVLGVDQSKFRLIQGNFRDLKNLIQSAFAPASPTLRGASKASADKQTDIPDQKFKGAIFDLGVSRLQLDTPERGFSFAKEGPLDMRMDPNLQVRAQDLINAVGRKELYALFSKLGEEKYSQRLADAVVLTRQVKPVTTTTELADLVVKTIGTGRGKIHPATRVFQALRIAVNDELNALDEGLIQVIDLIEVGGRIVVISFHSLEDRIVKNTFKQWKEEGLGQILTKKPIVAQEVEIKDNPRSHSAKMRVFEKGI